MAHKPRLDKKWVDYFEIINYIFLAIFVCEATMKIACMGKKYFKDSYNVFDFTIISISLITLVGEKGGWIKMGKEA